MEVAINQEVGPDEELDQNLSLQVFQETVSRQNERLSRTEEKLDKIVRLLERNAGPKKSAKTVPPVTSL